MKLAIFTTMGLNTMNTSVHGVDIFMMPLIKRLKKNNHEIIFCGKVINNIKHNIFCDIMKLKPYILDISKDIEINNNIDDCDALLIYNRPPEQEEEYNQQTYYINKAIELKIPILFWCGDLWFPPQELCKEIILLRPFLSNYYDNRFKVAYEFNYFTHDTKEFEYELEKRERVIDVGYVGNFYNRFNEFKKKFENCSGNIVVAGSWLRDSERWNQSLTLKNILFINEIPHAYALPFLNICKETYYIIPENYKDVGMKTSRIYEAAMTNCKIDVNIRKLNTLDIAYNMFIKIIENERVK